MFAFILKHQHKLLLVLKLHSPFISKLTESQTLLCVDGFKTDSDGRLGPGTVEFDYTGSFGTLVVEADRLGVSSYMSYILWYNATVSKTGQTDCSHTRQIVIAVRNSAMLSNKMHYKANSLAIHNNL